MLKIISRYIKIVLFMVWWCTLLGGIISIFLFPWILTPESFAQFLGRFGWYLLFVYFLLSALRGFTLIPSTPFVFAGLLLFPNHLHLVYIISMIGILLSASMVYFFSVEMEFSQIFEKSGKNKLEKYHKWVERYGFWLVMVWSFLIIVPTDIICYVAGTLRMNYMKFISAVAIGEGLICIGLIYGWDVILSFINHSFL